MAGAITDITEEKRLRRRLETVFEASPTGLVLADRGGKITLINSSGARLFGYEREELYGQPITVLVPGPPGAPGADLSLESLSSLAAKGAAEVSDLYGRRRDGSEFPIELGIRGVETDDGPAVICGISDTTTQRQAIETLQRAKEAADAANRAKSDFLANMSHEIRTPMCAVLGMTELVLDTELTTAQRECLGVVLESGESLLAIINEILDFSKIEAGKWELESTELPVRQTIGEALKSLALRANLKGLELAYLIESDVPEILLGDAGRLRQLIVNLVGNAIKFTERGEVVLRTWCESQTAEAVQLHVTVADTGVGIPADKQQVIFEAFTQADSSTTRRFGGTGLGLAIAQRVVALMNGRIWVDSEVGRGSTFHFTARFGRARPDFVAGPSGPPPELDHLPVLVVDDNATNRLILSTMLRNCGLVPTTAASAPEAWELLRSRDASEDRFALIVSDVNMPGMDGFELAARIRGTAEFADVTIVLLSSAERLGDRGRCAELGIAASLTKPVSQSELRDAVTAALTGRRQVAATALVKLEHMPPRALTPLRILVAEDGLANRRLLVGLLQKWGHTVTAVENGRAALAALDQQPFDLALMDVSMPEMDGLEATAAIRHQERHTNRHLPIIALTAHALSGDRERCLAAGMDSYLTKPVRGSELAEAIETLWGQTVAPASLPADSARPNPPPAGLDAQPIVLNWEAAWEAVGGDGQLLAELIGVCREECPALCRQLEAAVRDRRAAEIRRLAHTIKGAVRLFGDTAVATYSQRLEFMARDGALDGIEDVFHLLQGVLPRFMAALEHGNGHAGAARGGRDLVGSASSH
jgi:PAS domain S-box-containing protein